MNYFMAYGPYRQLFKGKTYRIAYDYINDSADGEKVLINDNSLELYFNNSISFNSNFEFEVSDKFKG